MFFNKQRRETDRMIRNAETDAADTDPAVINVKITSREQLFSAYSYSGDKLNKECSEYVFAKAKNVPVTEDIKIKIHTADHIDVAEAEQALKSHYRAEYLETKKEAKRVLAITLIMTVLGVLALTALILTDYFTDNLYATSIVEIAAWVFIWEAVDYFFLQRPVIKGKSILIQRIYTAQIVICNDESATAVS